MLSALTGNEHKTLLSDDDMMRGSATRHKAQSSYDKW